jgi:hypothetical protein
LQLLRTLIRVFTSKNRGFAPNPSGRFAAALSLLLLILLCQDKKPNPAASLCSAACRSLRSLRCGLRPQTPNHFCPGRRTPRAARIHHQTENPCQQQWSRQRMVGKPLAFDQMLLDMLALLPGPDRSGQPAPRNSCFGPHSACPYTHANSRRFVDPAARRRECAARLRMKHEITKTYFRSLYPPPISSLALRWWSITR